MCWTRCEVGQSLTYSRNPDYWGKDLPMMKGPVILTPSASSILPISNAAFEAFKGGTYTFRNETFVDQMGDGL